MKFAKVISTLLALVCAVSCLHDGTTPLPDETRNGEGTVFFSLSAASASINTDLVTWEDRVTEIRMLVFGTGGKTVINRMLRFPNGFENPCTAVNMSPGTYDFYFIANETAYSGDFVAALNSIKNVSGFATDPRFHNLAYDPGFTPDGTTDGGKFLMSAIYKSVVVVEGGTEANPQPLAITTNGIELVRSLARVEVIFRKRTSGGSVDEGTIASVQLHHVAAATSVPPLDAVYAGTEAVSNVIVPSGFDYGSDLIGSVVFYIPEMLRASTDLGYTEIVINGLSFPLETDTAFAGLTAQRRTIAGLSTGSVVRNYDYQVEASVNTEGGVQIETSVVPWKTAAYVYMFQDNDKTLVLPPVIDTPGGIVIPTTCGKVEIKINDENEPLSNGLQGAYNDQIIWYDPATGGPRVQKGDPPYYCEQKYGAGWRLINSCELMSFLAIFDQAYKVWQSNTWQGRNSGLTFYPAAFRIEAQALLQKISGVDMSAFVPNDSAVDSFGAEKLNIIDRYFTPGDFIVTLDQYPNNSWPYPAPPPAGIQSWFPIETITQVKAYWYSGYLDYNDSKNYDALLYQQFTAYSFSSTTSRCVRSVEE